MEKPAVSLLQVKQQAFYNTLIFQNAFLKITFLYLFNAV